MTNSNTLKLAYLLAQYLYTNKRLDLPGIGTFLLDTSVAIDPEKNKHHSVLTESISFQNNPSVRDISELVNYISAQSGKMKVLAESDIESHLQMVQQFLNINKPFSFEGIGTLVKVKQGVFEFTPGNIINTRLKDDPEKEKQTVSRKETVDAKYQAYLATPAVKSRWRKPVIVLLILAGIGLAIWGGYTISTNRSTNTEELVSANTIEQTAPAPDSTQMIKPKVDTVKSITHPDKYKYILEIAKATRAFRRYNILKDNQWDVRLETSDSIQYKLFLLLPVSSDTTRKMDSLTALSGKKVYIEHQN